MTKHAAILNPREAAALPTASLNEIYTALASAQLEMGKAMRNSDNAHLKRKYADLASVMDACMGPLNSHGIAVVQLVEGDAVVTRFLHQSGESLSCTVPMIIGKRDMQGLGSAMTYARRYGLMALAGIAPDDDDGEGSEPQKNGNRKWAQTIIDELPPNATEADKARAVTDAIIAQFNRKPTEGQLSNEWDRREAIVASFAQRFPDLHSEIIDAYENRMMAITGQDGRA